MRKTQRHPFTRGVKGLLVWLFWLGSQVKYDSQDQRGAEQIISCRFCKSMALMIAKVAWTPPARNATKEYQ